MLRLEVEESDNVVKFAWIKEAANLTANYLAAARHLALNGDSEGALAAVTKCLKCYPHVHAHVKTH